MAKHEFVTTEDGSPSLATTYENGIQERMHHFRGAMSESIYIYEPALDHILQLTLPEYQVMSLGLGLGYNELITAAVALRHNVTAKIRLTTYEIDEILKNHFLNWLMQKPDSWSESFDKINSILSEHYHLPSEALKNTLLEWQQNGFWQLRQAFPEDLPPQARYHVILYDAFSGKMDGVLWQQDFLARFLSEHCLRPSAFATYAATGNLKRALKQNGFVLQTKVGFGGKKESTLAIAAMQQI